jgi:DNA-binding IclR family transcriptional regulator
MPAIESCRVDKADRRILAGKNRLDRSGIRALSRAIEVLRSLENCPEGMSLGEIGKAISLPRSTVQRIVGTLSNEGFLIAASPSAKVQLGPAILQLAANLDFDMKQILRPFLRDLSSDTRETVDVSIQRGGSVVLVDQIIGHRGLVVISAVGDRSPLHCTANGKAILAARSLQDARRGLALSLREHGEGPLYEEDRLWRELEAIRSEAVSFDREEYESGVSTISTAFNGPSGGFLAISIRVPTLRFRHAEARLVEKLLDHRRLIVSKLT